MSDGLQSNGSMNSSRRVLTTESLYTYTKEYIYRLFILALPLDALKSLPLPLKYTLGFISLCALFITFIYFTVTTYNQGVSVQFISLQSNAGVCSLVAKAVSGTFMASETGYWQGNPKFLYVFALYSFQLTNLLVNQQQYSQLINSISNSLINTVGKSTAENNLAWNLMLLMAGINEMDVSGNAQFIEFTAEPSMVFDRMNLDGYLMMRTGETSIMQCDASVTTYFDTSTSTFSLQYNYYEFIEANCDSIMSPAFIASNFEETISSTTSLTAFIDMRSFVTAFAASVGILSYEFLEPILPSSTVSYSELFFGCGQYGEFTVRQVYDIRYPGMQPIMCIYSVPNPGDDDYTHQIQYFCLLEIGVGFWLPLFNHFGNNFTGPEYCDCDTNGNEPLCNEFSLMTSLMFVNNVNQSNIFDAVCPLIASFTPFLSNYSSPSAVFIAMNRAAYEAQYYAYDPVKYENDGILDFCGFNCSLMTIYANDDYNQAISTYFYQLNNGSCNNVFTSTNWDLLAATPPTNLTESYFACYEDSLDSFVNAVAVGFADTSALQSIMPLFLIPLIYFTLKGFGYPPRSTEFHAIEQKEMLEDLADELLRVRKACPGDDDRKNKHTRHVLRAMLRASATIADEELQQQEKEESMKALRALSAGTSFKDNVSDDGKRATEVSVELGNVNSASPIHASR